MIRRSYVDLPSGQVHLRRAGTPDSPTLVLLHQTPSTSAMYTLLMQVLANHFDVIALDTPGFGGSDAVSNPFSIAVAASALADAIDALVDGPCDWFGHHTGAALALQVATDRPAQVRRLALSGPCLLNAEMKAELPRRAAPVSREPEGQHLATLWRRMQAKDPEADAGILERETVAAALAGANYPEAYKAVTAVDTAAQLAALSCPTLVFAGTDDPLL
ncbi:MAG: alpha/beta fold hydrolase, partial [Abyssibacter sp.]